MRENPAGNEGGKKEVNRRSFLEALGIVAGAAIVAPQKVAGALGDSAEKAERREVLKMPEKIESMEDLELCVEVINVAINEDFEKQDEETRKLVKKTGDKNMKAVPRNGNNFLRLLEEFRDKLDVMMVSAPGLKTLDQVKTRYERVEGENLNASDVDNVSKYIRATLLMDVVRTKKAVELVDFSHRTLDFDATIGKKANRTVPTSFKDLEEASYGQKKLEFLRRILKIDEEILQFLGRTGRAETAKGLLGEAGEKFLSIYKPKSDIISLAKE